MNNKEKIYKSGEIKSSVILPGDSSELPDVFLKVAVFIDNAYLIRLKNHFFERRFKYNLKSLILKIAEKNNLSVEKIFLYDAPPFQSEIPNEEENKKKENYDKYAIKFKEQGIILREGRTQRLKIDNKFIYVKVSDNHTIYGVEHFEHPKNKCQSYGVVAHCFFDKQKGVDMLLGIDAVSIKNEVSVEGVVLLTGDSDFVPLVYKLKEQDLLVFLWTYFNRDRNSPFSRSNHLIESVSKYVKLTKGDFEVVGDE